MGLTTILLKGKLVISNLLNFIIWNIMFFSLFPLASASIASFVDINYESHTDLYDAILNTFFPIFFVIFLNASGKDGSIKNIILPLLDDVLYNIITWVIPLVVSFAYDDLMSIKICSIINMCLHVFCAILAIIKWKKVDIYANEDDDDGEIALKIACILFIICFYVPNILQTLLITLFWPINFYFVKACVFILVLSLTRNVSYFADKVPGNFLATSTTLTQCVIRVVANRMNMKATLKGMPISIEEMHEKQKTMQTKIDEIDEKQTTTQTTIDDMQKTMQAKMGEIQKTMNEIKTSMEETKKI
ncbi:hypothetical protein C1646_815370 [Rhizophagus diaphanus]|nr:hypothetical protein C1646_815370 [Rhizophagus diaphanus] [Rhizophagus sp. MUCL 43196]